MIYQDEYNALNAWQRGMVNAEALRMCRSDTKYRGLDILARGDWQGEVALWADGELYKLRDLAMDEVMQDTDFIEAITTEAEDRFMTRGNANVR